jgi:glycine reductase
VGAPRIVPTRGIPFPAGDPSLDPEAERAWRRRLLDRALEAVSTAVHAPTIFPMDESGETDETGGPPAHA